MRHAPGGTPEPAVAWSAALRRRFDAALVALGRLDAVTAELTSRQRGRVFGYRRYVEHLAAELNG